MAEVKIWLQIPYYQCYLTYYGQPRHRSEIRIFNCTLNTFQFTNRGTLANNQTTAIANVTWPGSCGSAFKTDSWNLDQSFGQKLSNRELLQKSGSKTWIVPQLNTLQINWYVITSCMLVHWQNAAVRCFEFWSHCLTVYAAHDAGLHWLLLTALRVQSVLAVPLDWNSSAAFCGLLDLISILCKYSKFALSPCGPMLIYHPQIDWMELLFHGLFAPGNKSSGSRSSTLATFTTESKWSWEWTVKFGVNIVNGVRCPE